MQNPFRILLAVALGAIIGVLPPTGASANGDQITVFASISLTNALQEIGQDFETQHPVKIFYSFAAPSILVNRIESGDGADIFFSADANWMDYLGERGFLKPGSRLDLLGDRLALIALKTSLVSPVIEPGFPLAKALGNGRLAIADPDLVPAGHFAQSALIELGVWNSVAGQVMRADNVRIALDEVSRGEAPLGIVYGTDARIEPKVKIVGIFPENTHAPIVYPAALTRDANQNASAFFKYLSGPEARATFQKYGFTVSAEP
jgi:molybdate transport system substrate-binding protein